MSCIFAGGHVDLQTLVALTSQRVTNPPSTRPEDIREMFAIYDTKNTGRISLAEMRHLLTTVGEKLTVEEADDLLKITNCVEKNSVVDYGREYLKSLSQSSILLYIVDVEAPLSRRRLVSRNPWPP